MCDKLYLRLDYSQLREAQNVLYNYTNSFFCLSSFFSQTDSSVVTVNSWDDPDFDIMNKIYLEVLVHNTELYDLYPLPKDTEKRMYAVKYEGYHNFLCWQKVNENSDEYTVTYTISRKGRNHQLKYIDSKNRIVPVRCKPGEGYILRGGSTWQKINTLSQCDETDHIWLLMFRYTKNPSNF